MRGCTLAHTTAIATVGESVVRLLNDAWTAAGQPGAAAKVFTAAELKDTAHTGVGLFLYRVAVNGPQRNRAARVTADGVRVRPSLPVDLHYLLVPCGPSVDRQHEALGWAMRTLEDNAVLPSGLLNAARAQTFAPAETVELLAEMLTAQEQAALWQGLQTPWRLSVGYVARMVALDSDVAVPGGPPVRAREFDLRGRAYA